MTLPVNPPTNLKVVTNTATNLTVSWSPVANAKSYTAQLVETNGTVTGRMSMIPPTTTTMTWNKNGLPHPSWTYYIEVWAEPVNSTSLKVVIPAGPTPPVNPTPIYTTTDLSGGYHPEVTDPQITGATTNPWVDQNVWSPMDGEVQKLDVYSLNHWNVMANLNDSGGAVHSFPNTGVTYGVGWQGFSTFVSGWDTTMDKGNDIIASACYDLWFDEGLVEEVMLHYNFSNRGDGPWWAQNLKFGGTTVGGVAIPVTYWSLSYVKGDDAAYFNLVDGHSNITSLPKGAVDIKAMLQYLVDQKILADKTTMDYWSNGYEVCSTGGVNHNFTMNNTWSYATK